MENSTPRWSWSSGGYIQVVALSASALRYQPRPNRNVELRQRIAAQRRVYPQMLRRITQSVFLQERYATLARGLGLSILREVAERHSGNVQLLGRDDAEACGLVVEVRFPAVEAKV